VRHREWRFRLEDILEAVGWIQRYTSGLTYAEFSLDRRTVDAVIRNFQVIGEAARHVPPEVEGRHPQVPWHQMRAMRNELLHVYFGVDLTIVWDTIHHHLPPLVPLLQAVLEAEGPHEG
jgi:uncharacterized protein with HEPN domain